MKLKKFLKWFAYTVLALIVIVVGVQIIDPRGNREQAHTESTETTSAIDKKLAEESKKLDPLLFAQGMCDTHTPILELRSNFSGALVPTSSIPIGEGWWVHYYLIPLLVTGRDIGGTSKGQVEVTGMYRSVMKNPVWLVSKGQIFYGKVENTIWGFPTYCYIDIYSLGPPPHE